jgi:sigma-B regulation protein RsbU (phosphoserine phosphatase)
LPEVDRARFAWTFRPCDELAGDILNIYQLDADHIGFYVLDVSGHGVPAALLSVTVSRLLAPHGPSSLLRRPADGGLAAPREVLEQLNRQFSREQSEQFFTLFYGVLDLASLKLCDANAGHPGPQIVSEPGVIRTLQNSSFPVGVVNEPAYEDDVVELCPGDRLWLYSDGLVEAMNKDGDQFGQARLERELRTASTVPVGDGVERLLRVVENWAGPNGPQDDISLIALGIAQARSAPGVSLN